MTHPLVCVDHSLSFVLPLQPGLCQWVHHPEVTPAQGNPRSGQMRHALFIAESFGGRDGAGVAGGQQTGEECAESEERGGCEQTARGKGVLHPVGEDSAEKAVTGKTDDDVRGRADERDARGDIEHIESTTVNGRAIIKIFLQPTATLARGHILAGKTTSNICHCGRSGDFSCQHP
jgi:hypothetical protein